MPHEIITTPDAPTSPFYSQAIKAGSLLLTPGIFGKDPNTGQMAGASITDQTRQALTNCEAILRAGGSRLADVIEVGVLLADPGDRDALNEEYRRWFPSNPPTRYVAKLGVDIPGVLVTIRMTAYLD